jgi:uncharacterized protein (TIGR02246 family)
MPAHSPEELDQLFEEALNAGDLDALAALYEPQAVFITEPGQTVAGTAAIREVLNAFVSLKPKITVEAQTLGQLDDIALTSARWEMAGTDPDGHPVQMSGLSTEVCRRQADGTWLFAIDNPGTLD